MRKIRFPISDENLPIEGVDVGASTTESDGFSAKVGVGDCVREVFGQSDESNGYNDGCRYGNNNVVYQWC